MHPQIYADYTEKNDFTVYPAIDLRQGQVVRLFQGLAAQKTVYSADPAGTAHRWLDAGAHWLHVVNLDGAFGDSTEANQVALLSILQACGEYNEKPCVQFGGGLRSLEQIEGALQLGVQRVILGTVAVENPALLEEALRRFGPQRVGLAMDTRQGQVRVRGWTTGSGLDPLTLGRQVAGLGLETCVYTEISRDGSGQGLDLPATQHFAEATGLKVIASGGLSSLDEIRQARQLRLAGVILGRALYEGQVDLQEALRC